MSRSRRDHCPRTHLPNDIVIIHPLPNPASSEEQDPEEVRRGADYVEVLAVHGFLYQGGLDQAYDYVRDHLKVVEDRQRGE